MVCAPSGRLACLARHHPLDSLGDRAGDGMGAKCLCRPRRRPCGASRTWAWETAQRGQPKASLMPGTTRRGHTGKRRISKHGARRSHGRQACRQAQDPSAQHAGPGVGAVREEAACSKYCFRRPRLVTSWRFAFPGHCTCVGMNRFDYAIGGLTQCCAFVGSKTGTCFVRYRPSNPHMYTHKI